MSNKVQYFQGIVPLSGQRSGAIGIDLELRNRIQGHAMTDVGSRHYDRWSYLPEKKEGMKRWAIWLNSVVSPIENSIHDQKR